MKITEKDLYNKKHGGLDLSNFPVKRKGYFTERKCLFIKPIDAYVPLTTLANVYLKSLTKDTK